MSSGKHYMGSSMHKKKITVVAVVPLDKRTSERDMTSEQNNFFSAVKTFAALVRGVVHIQRWLHELTRSPLFDCNSYSLAGADILSSFSYMSHTGLLCSIPRNRASAIITCIVIYTKRMQMTTAVRL